MPRIWVTLICLTIFGCGSEFASEREELAYLSSLSNPSPAQWKRKNELVKQEVKAEEARQKALLAPEEAKKAQEKAKADAVEIKRWNESAEELKSRGEWKLASMYYADIIKNHPGTQASKEAELQLAECYDKGKPAR